jgi:hypothetical protein
VLSSFSSANTLGALPAMSAAVVASIESSRKRRREYPVMGRAPGAVDIQFVGHNSESSIAEAGGRLPTVLAGCWVTVHSVKIARIGKPRGTGTFSAATTFLCNRIHAEK